PYTTLFRTQMHTILRSIYCLRDTRSRAMTARRSVSRLGTTVRPHLPKSGMNIRRSRKRNRTLATTQRQSRTREPVIVLPPPVLRDGTKSLPRKRESHESHELTRIFTNPNADHCAKTAKGPRAPRI